MKPGDLVFWYNEPNEIGIIIRIEDSYIAVGWSFEDSCGIEIVNYFIACNMLRVVK